MSLYNSPVPVGNHTISTFFPSYPPVQGNIGTNPSGWTFGSGYVAPFRSFDQQIVNNSWILGPYCRKLDGTSGRIVIDQGTGGVGFVQQCWYDYPRSPLEPYEENSEWWAKCGKVRITAQDQMVASNPSITIEVAISNYQSSSVNLFEPPVYLGLFLFRWIKLIDHAIRGGTCGVGTDTPEEPDPGYPDETKLNEKSPGLLSDLSSLISGALGALQAALGGGDSGPLGVLINSVTSGANEGPGGPGGDLSSPNSNNTLLGWLGDSVTALGNVITNLSDYTAGLATASAAEKDAAAVRTAGILGAVPSAADLFINGWFVPNLKFINDPNATGSAADPHKWRPSIADQKRYASYLAGSLTENSGGFVNGVPETTPQNPDTNQPDWGWFLTMLNRGDTTAPTIDTSTNEIIIKENYGFGRGGSIASTDTFLNSVESTFDQQTADSLGVLFDMSPASTFFITTVLPIVVLEQVGQTIKVSKGEPIGGISNLDAYQDTKFELRITAENLKAGNPTLYNYLTTTGDGNGNTLTLVP